MVQLSATIWQFFHYFVNHSSEFCRHKPLCCFSTVFTVDYFVIDSARKLGYTLVYSYVFLLSGLISLVFVLFVYVYKVFKEDPVPCS
jgi:hypothetical protein